MLLQPQVKRLVPSQDLLSVYHRKKPQVFLSVAFIWSGSTWELLVNFSLKGYKVQNRAWGDFHRCEFSRLGGGEIKALRLLSALSYEGLNVGCGSGKGMIPKIFKT